VLFILINFNVSVTLNVISCDCTTTFGFYWPL